MNVCDEILDLARWAPSGDNSQPWRFEIRSNAEILIHGYDTRDHCVYDLDGWASQLAHGALLETLTLAATRFGCRARSSIASEDPSGHVTYRVVLDADSAVVEDPLVSVIRERVVQRRPMWPKRMLPDQRLALERAVQPYTVIWLNSWFARGRMASLNARNAHIRLTIPEAYAVHKAVIAWNCKTSEDRMPADSLGADPILLGIMRWVMATWDRQHFFNRYLGGTVMPRLLLDYLPGVLCGGHFAILGMSEPQSTADRIAAGRAVQRFWLTATKLKLQLQPAYTPLVFARYAREHRRFTGVEQANGTAREIARRLEEMLGSGEAIRTVFLGRIGPARAVKGRSLRLAVHRLLVDQHQKH
jgi:sulfur-carrier protein adenylyltransferase/sulfurtransferase